MVRKIGLILLAILLPAATSAGQEWASKMFAAQEHDFGTVARGTKAEFDFTLSNIYIEDAHIQSARSSCGCTSVKIVNPELKTYAQGAIHATLNTGSFLGARAATITVLLDKPYPAEVQLHVKGYVRSDVVFEPGSVELGEVEEGTPIERKVTVNYAGRADWQVVDVKSGNPCISAKVVTIDRQLGRVSYEVAVHVDGKAPVGYLQDQLTLVTNEGQGMQIPLTVEGRIVSGVGITVSPSSLFMGVVQPGREVIKSLVVRSPRPFRIVSIACDDPSFTFGQPPDSSPKTLHVIPVKFTAGREAGKVTRTIHIVTDSGQSAPDLSAYAVVATRTAGSDQ